MTDYHMIEQGYVQYFTGLMNDFRYFNVLSACFQFPTGMIMHQDDRRGQVIDGGFEYFPRMHNGRTDTANGNIDIPKGTMRPVQQNNLANLFAKQTHAVAVSIGYAFRTGYDRHVIGQHGFVIASAQLERGRECRRLCWPHTVLFSKSACGHQPQLQQSAVIGEQLL